MPEPDLGRPDDLVPDVPGPIAAGIAAMVDREWLASANWQEQLRRADRIGQPGLWDKEPTQERLALATARWQVLDFERLLVRRMSKLGVPMFAHEVWRSAERQAELAADGFSKLVDGPHMHGLAVDVIHARKGWRLTRQQWAVVGHVGRELATQRGYKLTWGGTWADPWDPAHWQVSNWRELVRDAMPIAAPVISDGG